MVLLVKIYICILYIQYCSYLKLSFYFCCVWWIVRAWVLLWRGTCWCPSQGIVLFLIARAEGSQRLSPDRNLWGFPRHLLRVLKSAGACQALHHWISVIWVLLSQLSGNWGQWRDPFGITPVSLCTFLLFVRRYRANSSLLPFHCHFWGEADLEAQYREPVQAVIAAELVFLLFIAHYTAKPMTCACLLAPLKIPALKPHKKPGSAAWQNCVYP